MPIDRTVKKPSTLGRVSVAPDDRKLTSRGQERRDELIQFAVTRFAEQGYHPTSVAEIVDGVGVGKGVFYWYFSSKEDLLREILSDGLLQIRRHQQAAIRDEPNPLNRIEKGVRASLEWLSDHTEVMRLFDFAWTEQTFAADLHKGLEISLEDTARHLREAMRAGLIPSGDAKTIAIAIRGTTEEVARVSAAGFGEVNVDAVVDMVMGGVLGPERDRDGLTVPRRTDPEH